MRAPPILIKGPDKGRDRAGTEPKVGFMPAPTIEGGVRTDAAPEGSGIARAEGSRHGGLDGQIARQPCQGWARTPS